MAKGTLPYANRANDCGTDRHNLLEVLYTRFPLVEICQPQSLNENDYRIDVKYRSQRQTQIIKYHIESCSNILVCPLFIGWMLYSTFAKLQIRQTISFQ